MRDLKQVPRAPRNYNGNPLDYYLSHMEEFERFENRAQLSRGDFGMYRALIRYGQIGRVFPQPNEKNVLSGRRGGKIGGKRGVLSEDENLDVIAAYDSFNGNALEASKHLHYSYNTITKHWKDAGLRVSCLLPKKDAVKIINSYELFQGNACKASRHLPYSLGTIVKYWRDAGLKIKKRGRPRKE